MEPSAKTAGSVTVTPGKNGQFSRSSTSQGSSFGENMSPNLTKSSPTVKSASRNSISFMSPGAKIVGSVCVTPGKSPRILRSKQREGLECGENVNPNLSRALVKSERSGKSSSRNMKSSCLLVSPRNLMRERRFVVAKKKRGTKVCEKCKENGVKKCLCMAYESLRASQDNFFEKQCEAVDDQIETSSELDRNQNPRNVVGNEVDVDHSEKYKNGEELEEGEESGLSTATFKRNRDKLLEEARESVPDQGYGRVMHLVKAFEKLLSMRKRSNNSDGNGDEKQQREPENGSVEFYKHFMTSQQKVVNWALPGMQLPKDSESYSHESMSSFCPPDLFLKSEKLGLESRSSLGSSFGSVSSGAAAGGGRRSSTESCESFGGSRWKTKQLRVTDQKPFKLRTEQRGRKKEEELMRKIQKMMEEQERMRIPIAQGLPCTTDEPECLVRPPVKECTQPIDLQLNSDVRAVERAEFDHRVAEKMSLLEQYRMERERQQKLAEEEENRRVRKELVPRAQPMPYFDRPFVPRRSGKNPTIPKEPKFHIPEHKKIRCMSLTDFSPFTFHQ